MDYTSNLILSTSPTLIALLIQLCLLAGGPNSSHPTFCGREILPVWFSVMAGRRRLPAMVVTLLEGPEGDAPEHAVLCLLFQPQLRDEMSEGHDLCGECALSWILPALFSTCSWSLLQAERRSGAAAHTHWSLQVSSRGCSAN